MQYKSIHFILLFAIFIPMNGIAQSVNVSSGRLQRYEKFNTQFVTPRNIDVWLPDDYSPEKKYAVIYMHDGQMLFDSTITWNRQEWEIDETVGRMLFNREIRDCIIIGIWNVSAERYADYFPQKIIDSIPEHTRSTILKEQINGEPHADNYLKFIVQELKPFIDSTYSTYTDADHTFIIGSSMGGLISLYALCEYPEVFGGAACLSIHSPCAKFDLIDQNTDRDVASKFRDYLSGNLPPANTKKIYMDHGNKTGDAHYKLYQKKIDAIMREKGWDKKHWQTKFFRGTAHNEISWANRMHIPLKFLLKN